MSVGWHRLASSLQGLIVAFGALALRIGQQEEAGFFRNKVVVELDVEISGVPLPSDEEEHHPSDVGKLAVPFGPFIALSAVEYIFLGQIIQPLLTGGMLGPNGYLWMADTL